MKRTDSEPPESEPLPVFEPEFLEDLSWWIRTDRKAALRVLKLVDAVLRTPQQGIGKPERMKFHLRGCWSRRVTQEHRLVYYLRGDRIHILQARYHY